MTGNLPIKASYRWTADEVVAAFEMHIQARSTERAKKMLKRTKRLAGIMLVFSASSLVLELVLGFVSRARVALMLFLLFAACFFFAFPWLQRLQKKLIVRQFDKRPDCNRMLDYAIDQDGLATRIEGMSESSERWEAYVRVVRTPEGFLFYPLDQMYRWLPMHAFDSAEDVEVVAEIARQKAAEYRELSA